MEVGTRSSKKALPSESNSCASNPNLQTNADAYVHLQFVYYHSVFVLGECTLTAFLGLSSCSKQDGILLALTASVHSLSPVGWNPPSKGHRLFGTVGVRNGLLKRWRKALKCQQHSHGTCVLSAQVAKTIST